MSNPLAYRLDSLVLEARPVGEAMRRWHPVRPMRLTMKWLREAVGNDGGHQRPEEVA